MKQKKDKLLKSRLYCITAPPRQQTDYRFMVRSAIEGGADIIQLRDKTLSKRNVYELTLELTPICRKMGALFILNDHLDVALAAGADGAHLGQDDLPLPAARRIVNAYLQANGEIDFVLGLSTHSLEQALKAQDEGADYLGCGPVFATPTKPDYNPVGLELIAQYSQNLQIPFVAIGGIDLQNLELVLQAGAPCVAAVRAVCGQKNPAEAARAFIQKMELFHVAAV